MQKGIIHLHNTLGVNHDNKDSASGSGNTGGDTASENFRTPSKQGIEYRRRIGILCIIDMGCR